MKTTTASALPSAPMTPGIGGLAGVRERQTSVPRPAYNEFLKRFDHVVRERVGANTVSRTGLQPLFYTDVNDLWDIYLQALPAEERQHHTCNACRHFIQRYGNLVTIDSQGVAQSLLWSVNDYAPGLYYTGMGAMRRAVENARVVGVFIPSQRILGTPLTGEWSHLSVTLPEGMVNKSRTLSASQVMAERREDYKNMQRALVDFSQEIVAKALTILEADALYRAEKVLGPAKWLHDLQASLTLTPGGTARSNLLWRAIATAPPGYAHPRSSMIGTLLEDLAEGLPLADVSRKFKAKMHPLQYSRPQAAPSSGNIAAAEKLVAKMGIENSLPRRFARPDEVQTIWQARAKGGFRVNTGGVFSGITPKDSPTPGKDLMDLPKVAISWTRFAEVVLADPKTLDVEVYLETGGGLPLAAFLTAVYPEAPPILQWDRPEVRNPVSWYTYSNGSTAVQWKLKGGQFHKVWGVSLKPSHWFGNKCDNHSDAAIFLIEGIRETRNPSACLFPEILSSEMRPVRSTIEAYSKANRPADNGDPQAAGLMFSKDVPPQRVRVSTATTRTEYIIDRWI